MPPDKKFAKIKNFVLQTITSDSQLEVFGEVGYDKVAKFVKFKIKTGVAKILTSLAGEIASFAEKIYPVAEDVFVLEDSANGYAKKKVKWSRMVEVMSAQIGAGGPAYDMGLVGGTTSTPCTLNQWTKMVMTLGWSFSRSFTVSGNRATYTGDIDTGVRVSLSGSVYTSGWSSKTYQYGIVLNGNTSKIYGLSEVTTNANNTKFPIVANGYIPLISKNGYVELWVRNITGSDAITLSSLNHVGAS